MDNLFAKLIESEKFTLEQAIELLLTSSPEPAKLREQLEFADSLIHIIHAVKSGTCLPYLTIMLSGNSVILFRFEEEMSNYPCEDLGQDIEQCSSLRYLTSDPYLYFKNHPRVSIQEPNIETSSYRERAGEGPSINSYPLSCVINIRSYGLQAENLRLPNPVRCAGAEIMLLWLEELVGETSLTLETRHYNRFRSFFKVPGLQVYYPSYSFLEDRPEEGERELESFKTYFVKKVEPELRKIITDQNFS